MSEVIELANHGGFALALGIIAIITAVLCLIGKTRTALIACIAIILAALAGCTFHPQLHLTAFVIYVVTLLIVTIGTYLLVRAMGNSTATGFAP